MRARGAFGHPEEGEREKGSVLFADPCMPTFTGAINDFVGPASGNTGPQATPRIHGMTGNLVPWGDHTGYRAQQSWSEMNRKKGTLQETEDE